MTPPGYINVIKNIHTNSIYLEVNPILVATSSYLRVIHIYVVYTDGTQVYRSIQYMRVGK
jgi:hypothetical protein